jgi:hypothetical protein
MVVVIVVIETKTMIINSYHLWRPQSFGCAENLFDSTFKLTSQSVCITLQIAE